MWDKLLFTKGICFAKANNAKYAQKIYTKFYISHITLTLKFMKNEVQYVKSVINGTLK